MGTCKNGDSCTFAHDTKDKRTENENQATNFDYEIKFQQMSFLISKLSKYYERDQTTVYNLIKVKELLEVKNIEPAATILQKIINNDNLSNSQKAYHKEVLSEAKKLGELLLMSDTEFYDYVENSENNGNKKNKFKPNSFEVIGN